MSAGNLHMVWAEVLLEGFAAAGVRQVVVSPGSRSTPLALAAAGNRRLATTVVLDERSAAFLALGAARVSGRPSLLICTSGTAGASYLPAIIEAAEADVPLLALTADRPFEAQGRQAAQTTDQVGMFGRQVRAFLELGAPDADPRAMWGLASTAALAVARTLDPRPGPVHLNARFRAPLEPQGESHGDAALRTLAEEIAASPAPRFSPPRRLADTGAIREVAAVLAACPHGLILAGPGPLRQLGLRGAVEALAGRLGYPLLVEATSQLRHATPRSGGAVDFVDLVVPGSALLPDVTPDVVLQIGRPMTSAAWTRCLEARPACRRVVLAAHGWNDPAGGATHIVPGDLELTLPALLDALGEGSGGDAGWCETFRRADAACRVAALALHTEEAGSGSMSEVGALREVLAGLGDGLVMVANSLAVREVDYVPAEVAHGNGVLSQRGVNGIDGLVSGASGAALASGGPLVLLVGDLAFQHDIGGLAAARGVTTPLPIVVLDNGGGGIFELLPLRRSGVAETTFRELFLTPQALDVARAAEAFGIPAVTAATHQELRDALAGALGRSGPTVIVARISGPGPRERRLELVARAKAVLEAP